MAIDAKKSPMKKKVNGESKINEIIVEGGGQIVKMEIDCSAIVEVKIPEAEKLAKENRLNEALELLLGVEKQTRNGADMHSACKVLVAIVKLCYEVTIDFVRKLSFDSRILKGLNVLGRKLGSS